jgi:sugar/nucleoside kinase (ribokinase family)
MSDIVVVGSLAYDSISTLTGKVDRTLGGSANYFSVVASHYAGVRVVGVVGTDYTDQDLAVLKSRNIDTSGIKVENGNTFHWEGRYGYTMNDAHTVATELNVLATFAPKLNDSYREAKVVFLANIDPVLQLDVLDQVKAPDFVACDTMNFWIETKRKDVMEVLKKVNALLINETESMMLTKEPNAIAAAPKIAELGPECVVIKRGEYGFVMYFEGQYFILPAFPIQKVVDPTGAGDSFAGGFMGHLAGLNKKTFTATDYKMACIQGTVAASFTVEDFGLGRTKTVTKDEMKLRHEKYRSVVASPLL